jgi:hypothetical protein
MPRKRRKKKSRRNWRTKPIQIRSRSSDRHRRSQ